MIGILEDEDEDEDEDDSSNSEFRDEAATPVAQERNPTAPRVPTRRYVPVG